MQQRTTESQKVRGWKILSETRRGIGPELHPSCPSLLQVIRSRISPVQKGKGLTKAHADTAQVDREIGDDAKDQKPPFTN